MLDKQLSVALSSAIKAGEYVLNIYNKNDTDEAIDELQGRGLARPVSPDESHDFPRIEGKGNVFELEFRILFAEILDF